MAKISLVVRNQEFNPNPIICKNYFIMAAPRINKFRRIWQFSPRLAVAFLRRKATRKAKSILLLPKDEWNINWLGEEMRPFNSLHG